MRTVVMSFDAIKAEIDRVVDDEDLANILTAMVSKLQVLRGAVDNIEADYPVRMHRSIQ